MQSIEKVKRSIIFKTLCGLAGGLVMTGCFEGPGSNPGNLYVEHWPDPRCTSTEIIPHGLGRYLIKPMLSGHLAKDTNSVSTALITTEHNYSVTDELQEADTAASGGLKLQSGIGYYATIKLDPQPSTELVLFDVHNVSPNYAVHGSGASYTTYIYCPPENLGNKLRSEHYLEAKT